MVTYSKTTNINIDEKEATLTIRIANDDTVYVTTMVAVPGSTPLTETFNAADVLSGAQTNNLRTFTLNLIRRTIANGGYV